MTPWSTSTPALRDRLAAACSAARPALPTGAGHDAGVLAAHVPTAMLFVRNPTGVTHAPGRARRAGRLRGGRRRRSPTVLRSIVAR